MGLPNNQDAVYQQLTVLQPKACEIYYNICGSIDQHTRHQQDTLQMEKKMQIKNWDKRVITSLFGMYCVDAWTHDPIICAEHVDHFSPWSFSWNSNVIATKSASIKVFFLRSKILPCLLNFMFLSLTILVLLPSSW